MAAFKCSYTDKIVFAIEYERNQLNKQLLILVSSMNLSRSSARKTIVKNLSNLNAAFKSASLKKTFAIKFERNKGNKLIEELLLSTSLLFRLSIQK